MHALSAPDAISLAIQRTRDFLFRPFRWGTYLKLGLVAILTEGFANSSHSSRHGGPRAEHIAPSFSPFHLSPASIAMVVAALLLAAVIALFVFYLITRLRFAYFHCLTTNNRMIRPGWHLYRHQATRFFWFNLVVGIAFFLVAALVLLPFAIGMFRIIHGTASGAQPDMMQLLALLLPLFPIVLVLVLAGVMCDVALRDWMLPHYALENATASQAWAQVWARIQADKRQFFVFTLLRLILPIIAYLVLFLLLTIPGLFALGAMAMFGYGVHGALAGAAGASSVIAIALEVFFGILAFSFIVFASICLAGPVCTAIREYALVFYGSRYSKLGALLYPDSSQAGSPGGPLTA